MNFTRYFFITPRSELIKSIAQVDAEGAAGIEQKEVWSVEYSHRTVPGDDVDTVLSTKIKLAFLLHVAAEYGLAEANEDAFQSELKRAVNWPQLSVESFDRNWELAFSDVGVIRLEECEQAAAGLLKSMSLQLPKELTVRGKENVADWLGTLAMSQPQ